VIGCGNDKYFGGSRVRMVATACRKTVWPQVGKFRLDSRRCVDAILFPPRRKNLTRKLGGHQANRAASGQIENGELKLAATKTCTRSCALPGPA
jgi:hypothetical protein